MATDPDGRGHIQPEQRGRPVLNWSRLGLKEDEAEGLSSTSQQLSPTYAKDDGTGVEPTFDTNDKAEKNELFSEDQSIGSRPWWKANFFLSEPVLFGTWDGVFTSCMINIFGILIFLRTGWMVGNSGVCFSVLIIFMTISVALVAVLSAIGVCERCHMKSGGVYFLLTQVLGARIGASVGILYCFGQAVACSLCVIGFGESIAVLIHHDNNIWVARGIAVGILIILSGINMAGVQWVIRLQLVLLVILFVAVLDFTVGSFVHTDPGHGFVGYRLDILQNNTYPQYAAGESFFTIFGVFFPTATGVFAGINMSGDLRNPSTSIPVGTLSAVAVSTTLYLLFALILGATCVRPELQANYMIAERVSITGFLFLAGLYISSISSGMGGLYGSPRILQSIANDEVIPIIRILSKGRGANKVPVFAIVVISLIALIFIFIGQVNTLGPIVTMPFMLTYAAVDYSHFVLAMSCDELPQPALGEPSLEATCNDDSKSLLGPSILEYGAVKQDDTEKEKETFKDDGRTSHLKRVKGKISPRTGDESETTSLASDIDASTSLLGSGNNLDEYNSTRMKKSKSCCFIFCMPWISLVWTFVTLAAMFSIQWIYALVNIIVVIIIYIYIGQASPGVFQGIAQFSLWKWLVKGLKRICCRIRTSAQEQVVITQGTPVMETTSAQLTEDNEDFASRGRYHQSKVVEGKNFDDCRSD